MYKETEAPCLAFRNMLTSITTQQNDYYGSGWRTNLPWIYYTENGQQVIEKNSRVQGKVQFQTTSTSKLGFLRFVMGTYSLEGDFLGFKDLTTQLQLCPADYGYGIDYRKFGTTVRSSCKISVSKLIDPDLQPNNTDVFYDLWLIDTNSNYIDVPVKIINYVDSSGKKPNESSDKASWKLTRRFFIYDTKSGIEGTNGYTSGTTYGTYVRWLDKVKLVIELNTNSEDSIFVPYVELEYRSKAKSFLSSDSTSTVNFETVYTMDSGSFWLVAWIFFGIAFGVAMIMTIWKTYVWCCRHPRQLMGSVYSTKLILNMLFLFADSWSTMMFWYLFAVAASFYFFFKLDQAPYLVMPQDSDGNLLPFAIIFGIMMAFKLICISVKVVKQALCSYYVLDREKNMSSLYSTLTNALKQRGHEDRDYYARETEEMDEPKAWRPIFVMNEMNELQTYKVISVEVVLIWTSFFMVGQGWVYASQYQPTVNFNNTRSPESYVLAYFLFTLVIMVTGVTLYLLRYIIAFLFPLRYMDFVDLCSVANVSIFIFDEKFHGYYIHGESPSNSSDVTIGELKRALDNESEGNAAKRGLTAKNPNLQTYEFYLPYAERKDFDEVFDECKEALKTKKGDEDVFVKKTQKRDFIFKSKDIGMFEEDFRKIVTKKDELDYHLVYKLQEIRRNPNQYISDVTAFYNFTRLPPESIFNLDRLKLVADRFMHFTRILLSDLDFDILWIMVCFYTALDALGLHVLHTTLIFYCYYKLCIVWPRKSIGEWNLSRTSGIDGRFLI